MVDGGKITLRVEVDAKEFENFMKKSPKDMTQFERSVKGAQVQTEKLGETATTTAVRFQTLTQGTINLVTSFTQAYTSISNLQKAKTSLQAAAVGVERAIDLQRRKQFMLNEEMAKAQPNMKKVELLTNELATAHDDLAVKQQRVKDQADQVNDTYILFGLNIANVGFSAVQTGVSMVKMTQGIKIADAAAKVFNATTGKYTLIALAAIAAWEGLAFAIGTFNKELGDSLSIFKNVQRLMEEFTGASEITLDHYDEKISGVSTSTRDFENSWKSMTNTVKQETDAQTELVKHWERQYKRSVANIQIEMGRQKQITSGTTGGTQGNFPNAQQGVEARVQETEKKVDSLFDYIFPNIPLAQAEEQIKQNISKQDDNVYPAIRTFAAVQGTYVNPIPPLHQFYMDAKDYRRELRFQQSMSLGSTGTAVPLTVEGMLLGTTPRQVQPEMQGPIYNPPQDRIERFQQFATGLPDVPSEAERIQAEIDNLRMIEQELVNDYERHGGNVVWTWYTAAGNTALKILDLESELDALTERNPKIKPPKPKSKDERNQEFLSTFIDENTPAFQLRLGSMTSQKRGLFKQRQAKLKQIAIEKFERENFPRTIQFGTQTFTTGRTSPRTGTGVFYAGIGGNIIAGMQNIMGGTFGMGNRRLGTSEGNMIEALRRAQMATIDPNARRQRTGIDVSGFERNNYQANAAELYQYGATSTLDYMDGISAFGQAAVAAGAVSVSQVRGSTRFDARNAQVIANRRRQLDIKDRNTNLLRFGGKLREGMSVWDEGAVIGGYSSPKAFSEASRRTYYSAVDEAQRFLSRTFGGGIQSSRIRGRSSGRSEYNRVRDRATSIQERLSLAGIGYKTFSQRLPYRHSRSQYEQYKRDWYEVRAYNLNQLAKADQINLLEQEFDVRGFIGSSLSLPSLQDEVMRQDSLMKSIGLTRTEAFQIIDTEGRGREEIDDRIRFKDRMSSMSTGVSVL